MGGPSAYCVQACRRVFSTNRSASVVKQGRRGGGEGEQYSGQCHFRMHPHWRQTAGRCPPHPCPSARRTAIDRKGKPPVYLICLRLSFV